MSATLKGSAAKVMADQGNPPASRRDGPPWTRRLAEVRAHLSEAGHDASLDGVRGLAVGLVFLVHVYRIVGPLLPETSAVEFWLRAVSVTGQVGVYLFFALSGFLIYGLVKRRKPSYGRFLWRRIQRIYPTFLAVAGLYVAICFVAPSLSKLPSDAGAAASYLARALILLPGLAPEPPLVTVAWTLRYEMAFYLLVGALVFVPPFFRMSARARVAVALVLLALTLTSWRTTIASMFVFGILAQEADTAMRGMRLRGEKAVTWAVALAVIPASVYMFLPEIAYEYPDMPSFLAQAGSVPRFLLLGPILAAIVFLASRPENPIARFTAWKPVRAFGVISYSYYLSHGIGIHIIEKAIRPVGESGYHSLPFALGMLWLSFALTVLLALLFFFAIEFPASIRKRIAY